MSSKPSSLPQKSTTVRFISALASGVGRVAPSAIERWALSRFSTPLRPSPPRAPTALGLPGHAFTLELDAWSLAAWEWGDGPTVLLVHGWNGDAAQLQALVRPLVQSGFHVVAVDLPGHGQSSGTEVTVLDLAHAIAEVGRRFGPLHGVFAHSLGATATALALSEGMKAERAVLVAPPVEMTHFLHQFTRYLGLSDQVEQGMRTRIEARLGRPVESFDLRTRLSGVPTRALVLHDPEDREVPFEHGRALAEAWPGASLRAVDGLGHRAILRDVGEVARAVAFLTESAAPFGAMA